MGTFTIDNKSPVVDNFGAARIVERSGSITSSTDATNLINTIKFQKGMKLGDLVLEADGIGATDLTMAVGYTYDDTSLTSDTDAFFTAADIGQTGGGHIVWPSASTSLNVTGFEALGDGQITVTTGGGAIDTDFALAVRANLSYGD